MRAEESGLSEISCLRSNPLETRQDLDCRHVVPHAALAAHGDAPRFQKMLLLGRTRTETGERRVMWSVSHSPGSSVQKAARRQTPRGQPRCVFTQEAVFSAPHPQCHQFAPKRLLTVTFDLGYPHPTRVADLNLAHRYAPRRRRNTSTSISCFRPPTFWWQKRGGGV